ncbi:RNA-binding protein [Streptomyces sp. NPDC006544]|uniref:RNA-binding protein n=1 Tax=Streptomyces sp. NPDC006544 TaxID=3154583 RepID=UPI0033B8ACBE
MSPTHVYRVTKYDPADRAPDGTYHGPLDTDSDHGPVDAAYLAAVRAFAEESGVQRLAVREPGIGGGSLPFRPGPAAREHPLDGLFPADLTGFHDGAVVALPLALELLRRMLGGSSVWCRLATEDGFAVQVGWDQYVYVTTRAPCPGAVARTRELGLFADPIEASPYDPAFDDAYELRPADQEFWERVRASAARGGAGLLEEMYVDGASRWHPLGGGGPLDSVRAALAPRALLNVWPALSTDIAGLLAALPEEFTSECVWEDADGRISNGLVDEDDRAELARLLAGARAAALLPICVDEHDPLFTGVLPDPDGVVRARWQL